MKYWANWFASQSAWTKVPFHSEDTSACLTIGYVEDFLNGLPMGVWKVNKPLPVMLGKGQD